MVRKIDQRSPVVWALMLVVAAIAVFANASGDRIGLGDDRAALVRGYAVEVPIAIDVPDLGKCVLEGDDAASLADPFCIAARLTTQHAPVAIEPSLRDVLLVENAPAKDKWAIRLLVAAMSLSIIGAALALARVLQSTVVFAAGTAFWLRVCAGFVALGGLVLPWIAGRFEAGLIETYATPRDGAIVSAVDPGPELMPLLVVVALLALAEVWRRGVRLREEAEATI